MGMSRSTFFRKQSIYRAVEAENAQKEQIVLAPGKPKYAHKDERDPIDQARAVAAAMKASR